jgi:hypothetical protein
MQKKIQHGCHYPFWSKLLHQIQCFYQMFGQQSQLLQRPWIVPIPGTTKLPRLEENLAAAAVQLTPEELRDIDSSLARIKVQGDRYPAHLQERVGR